METIIFKYLRGSASRQEIAELEKYLSENENNRREFFRLKNILEITDPVFSCDGIDLARGYESTRTKIKSMEKRRTLRLVVKRWQQIAAILILPVTIAALWMVNNMIFVHDEISYQEVVSPFGARSNITLPDGSSVCLNAGSRLRYPMVFRKGERVVRLEGEAFFDVASDKNNKFVVQTSRLAAEATGTRFNVKAYPEDNLTDITLIEGAVAVKMGEKSVNISPDERLSYDSDSEKYSIFRGDPYRWYAWKDGVMVFRNDRLSDVFKRLSQVYNVDFEIGNPEIAEYVYYATFEGEFLEEILSYLEMSVKLRFERKGDGPGQSASVIKVYKR